MSNPEHPESLAAITQTLEVEGLDLVSLFGPKDELLRQIELKFPEVQFLARGNQLSFTGTAKSTELAFSFFEKLLKTVKSGVTPNPNLIDEIFEIVSAKTADSATSRLVSDPVILATRGKTIRAKTPGQRKFVAEIDNRTIVFGIGPAGTGKTYLAMAKAVQALQQKQVERIILTRPAVEAGERLGYLPGSLTEKIDPYLRPLFDAVNEMMNPELVMKLMNLGVIEVAPLAYMRGRTLNDSFIILDEAQNTTDEQMKMFLTRLGFGSRMVITGDLTQIDLPGNSSGLKNIETILGEIEELSFVHFTSEDVVRHNLVGQIVEAYNQHDESNKLIRTIQNRSASYKGKNR